MKITIVSQSNTVVYHGTNERLTSFDGDKQQSGYYPGFYVTESKSLAETFGSLLYSFTIDKSKFYDLPDNKSANDLKDLVRSKGFFTTEGSGYGDVEYLKSIGYYGIKRGATYVVFEPQNSLTRID